MSSHRPFFHIKHWFYLARTHSSQQFYIGQVSTGLGDMMLYSHLPHLIKGLSLRPKVFVYETEMAKVVFAHNPYVDGFFKDRRRLWKGRGSGCDLGPGHFTQQKARFFGITRCLPKGELFLSPREKASADQQFPKPLATLQAHGKTIHSPVSDKVWESVVKELQKTHSVIQLKSSQENTIQGVDGTITGIRACMVLQSKARIHVGLDSGFMHTAAAFDIPTIVILNNTHPDQPFLYPQHSFIHAPALTASGLREIMNFSLL